MDAITLNQLIEEGTDIKNKITYINPPSSVIRLYSTYRLADNSIYEIWKSKAIRFLSISFPNDRCVNDFEEASKEFTKNRNSPILFDRMLAILQACLEIPQIINDTKNLEIIDKSINVNVSQKQSQQQSQSLDLFMDLIKDELTEKQYQEIQGIIKTEHNPALAKTKLVDKIKSFGVDITSNIIANIITTGLCL